MLQTSILVLFLVLNCLWIRVEMIRDSVDDLKLDSSSEQVRQVAEFAIKSSFKKKTSDVTFKVIDASYKVMKLIPKLRDELTGESISTEDVKDPKSYVYTLKIEVTRENCEVRVYRVYSYRKMRLHGFARVSEPCEAPRQAPRVQSVHSAALH